MFARGAETTLTGPVELFYKTPSAKQQWGDEPFIQPRQDVGSLARLMGEQGPVRYPNHGLRLGVMGLEIIADVKLLCTGIVETVGPLGYNYRYLYP